MRKDRQQRYNPDWLAVSADIRIRRANNRCEMCGLKNGVLIHKERNQAAVYATPQELEQLEKYKSEGMMSYWQRLKTLKLKQIALSVAHLDRNEKNDKATNLICLCQWCHLEYDRQDNSNRRRYGYSRNELPISHTL